jgi:hypothetical protein
MRNLAHIGFEVHSLEEFEALAEMAYRLGKPHRVGRNQYYQYTDPSGAELWTQLDENDEISGMSAHFHGAAQVDVTLLRAQAYEDRPLDGTFEARPLQVDAGLPKDTPPPHFAFDLPDAHLVPSVVLPAEARVQLVGFAREVHCYECIEDYHKAHPGKPFEVIEVIEADRAARNALSSLVRIDGIVVSTKQLQNLHTKRHFFWLLVKTAIGKVEIVASSRSMPALPQVGGIFDGQVRLSGRVELLHPVAQKPGLIERFFWGADSNQRLDR